MMPAESQPGRNESSIKKVLYLVFSNFYAHNVAKNAAALAYYLLFALFPLLIFLSNLLGLLDLNVFAIIQTLKRILPNDVTQIIESYLDYASSHASHTLMWFSLVFSVWFPMRAAKGLMDDVRRAYGLEKPKRPLNYAVKQLIYTLVLLLVMVLTLVISVLGKNVISYITGLLPNSTLKIPDNLINLWQYLRFLPVTMLIFAAVGTLYSISLEQHQPIKALLPGITAAMFFWLIFNIGFSFYVENFANYSLIYGTLGAVIVLLIWLYMTSVVMILGAELNAAILTVRNAQT